MIKIIKSCDKLFGQKIVGPIRKEPRAFFCWDIFFKDLRGGFDDKSLHLAWIYLELEKYTYKH